MKALPNAVPGGDKRPLRAALRARGLTMADVRDIGR